MSNKKKQSLNKTQSSNISKEFTWIVKEGLLIGLVAISFYLLIALLSYSPEDPGFHSYGSQSTEVTNLAGFFGAWISDLSLSSVGYTAYLIPFLLIHQALNIFREKLTRFSLNGDYLFFKFIGLLLTIIGATCLLSLSNFNDIVSLNYGAGGLLGQSLMNSLSSTLYPLGTFISMLSITLIGLTLLADISWLKFIELVGSSTFKFFEFFLKYLTSFI